MAERVLGVCRLCELAEVLVVLPACLWVGEDFESFLDFDDACFFFVFGLAGWLIVEEVVHLNRHHATRERVADDGKGRVVRNAEDVVVRLCRHLFCL